MKQYYVYELISSLDMRPFYVGKGTGNRMYIHKQQALGKYIRKRPVHSKIINILNNGGDVIYNKIDCNSERDAIEQEILLIKQYGRRDLNTGYLCNLTDGGEGMTRSPASSAKAAEKNRGKKRSSTSRERMRAAQLLVVAENLKKYGQKTKPGSQQKRILSITGSKRSQQTKDLISSRLSKQVSAYNKTTGEYIGTWKSVSQCAKSLNVSPAGVASVARGALIPGANGKKFIRKSCGGYTFKYEKEV